MDFEIDLSGLDRMRQAVGATEKIAETSLLMSLKRTQRWLTTHIGRAVAKEAKLPVRAIKARIRLRIPQKGNIEARIWIGLDPMAASRAGKPRQTRAGVTVGKHQFAHAFLIRGTRVVRRTGRNRFPIETARIPVAPSYQAVVAKAWPDGQQYFLDEFERQMRWRMERLAA